MSHFLLPFFGQKYRREMPISDYFCTFLSQIARQTCKILHAPKNGGGEAAATFVCLLDYYMFAVRFVTEMCRNKKKNAYSAVFLTEKG